MHQARSDASSEPSSTEVPFVATAITLLRWRKAIVLFAVACAVAGGLSAWLRDREYVSRATFLPKGTEESVSGIALAASQFGVQLPNKSGEWWPAVYVELLNSRTMLEALAHDTVTVAEEAGRRASVLDLFEVKGDSPAERVARSVMILREQLSATEDKKLGAVKVTASTQWPSVSLALVQRLVAEVNTFNLDTRRELAAAERQFVDQQVADAEKQLRSAEDRLQAFLTGNRIVSAPELTFERDRLQREVSLRMQMYTTLMQNREQVRLKELRNTPVITMIEAPRLPVIPEKRGAVVRALLGLVAGGLLGVLAALMLRGAAPSGQADTPEWRELTGLLRDATPRVLRRWIGV